MIDLFNTSHANGKVIITHNSLRKIFEDSGFDVIHLSAYRHINDLPVNQIFTPDIAWVTTCTKCEYLQKPPARIHSKKFVDKFLQAVDRYLVDK